jgi:hypothetical protein
MLCSLTENKTTVVLVDEKWLRTLGLKDRPDFRASMRRKSRVVRSSRN